MPRVRIQILGALRIVLPGGVELDELGPQSGALVACLALEPRRVFTREELIDCLWPDDDLEEGRRKLRQLVYSLRRQLEGAGYAGSDPFVSTRATLQIDAVLVEVDAQAFAERVARAEQATDLQERAALYREAAALYQGELLPGFYQDAVVAARDRLATLAYGALHALALTHERLGQPDEAICAARRALEINSAGEEAHGDLMRLYSLTGRPSLVLAQYRELERALRSDLDAEPSQASRDLLAALRGAEQAPPPVPVALPAPPPAPVALPAGPRGAAPAHARPEPAAPPVPPVPPTWGPRRMVPATLALALMVAGWLGFGRERGARTEPIVRPTAGGAGDLVWTTRYHARAGDKDSEPTSAVTDAAGNTYVAGFVDTEAHDVDFLVLKYDGSGKPVWEYRYNGPGHDVDRARSIALDAEGNVYVTGDSDNGRGSGQTRLSGLDFATIKLGPDGRPSPTWRDVGRGTGVRRYNGPDNGEDVPARLLVDESGGVYVMGSSYSRKGDRDYAVVKYDPAGRQVWSRRYDSPDHDEDWPSDMALTNDGALIVTGWSRLRPGDEPEADVLTMKVRRTDGRELWERRWGQGNHADDAGQFVFVDHWNMIRVVGEGRTGPGTYNHTRSGYVTLTYDAAGKLHRARGALSERDQLDSVQWAWGSGAIGERAGRFAIVCRDESGTQSTVTEYRPVGVGARFVAGASGSYVYVVGALPPDDRQEPPDYVTLGVSYAGSKCREWSYGGRGDPAAPDVARAVAVHDVEAGPSERHETVVVTGQSQGDRTRDIVTLCYRSF